MGHIVNTVHIDAPLERVFELGADAGRLPEWNTSFVQVKDVTGPLDQVGARYTTVIKVAGRLLTVSGRSFASRSRHIWRRRAPRQPAAGPP